MLKCWLLTASIFYCPQDTGVPGNTHAFIVRIWHEAIDTRDNVVAWRGSVEHVGSGRRLNFDDMAALIDFLQELSGLEQESTASWWQSLVSRIRPQL